MKPSEEPTPGPSSRLFAWAAVAVIAIAAAVLWTLSRPGAGPSSPESGPKPFASTEIRPFSVDSGPDDSARPDIAAAIGRGGRITHAERTHRVMQIRRPLEAGEVEGLLRALLTPPEPGTPAALRATWFHETANLLHRQETDLREFAGVLATVARDSSRAPVTRDYALQHLRRIWPKATPDLRGDIEATFAEFAGSPGELRAAAMLGLHLIDPDGSRGMDDSIVTRAVRSALAADAASGDSLALRMTATRIVGERGLSDQRPRLMNIASSPREHALLRMAAVAALGTIGDPEDLRILATLDPADERIEAAIFHAIGPAAH